MIGIQKEMSTDSSLKKDLKSLIDLERLPQHVAIVMDGNGRWAKKRFQPRVFGHKAGVKSARQVVEAASNLGIKTLTLYAFSEENWGRPKDEIKAIFSLIDRYILADRQTLNENNIRFDVIGNLTQIPLKTLENIQETKKLLEKNTGMTLVIALSYGSRQEITVACKSIAQKVQQEELSIEEITPKLIEQSLWSGNLPELDLFIRTSGELRVSNFLLWQLAYAELWFSEKCWPDFEKDDFFQAIIQYQKRHRRYGLLT